MNWDNILEHIETYNRQRLTSVCHLAGCWHSCPSSVLQVKRGALGEPLNDKLYSLCIEFHKQMNKLLTLWEEVHFYQREKIFNREKFRAQQLLTKILNYEKSQRKLV